MNKQNIKRKIVLASVLKPVDDVRMFQKFALSLKKYFDIHIIGHQINYSLDKDYRNIHFYPIFKFDRKSENRIRASLKFFKNLRVIKPEIIVIHAVELLPISYLYKILNPKVSIIYDIRENYRFNIKYQNIYPWYLKGMLTLSIKLIEEVSSFFISHYFLAEKSYENELSFMRKKYSIIQNKSVEFDNDQKSKNYSKKIAFNFVLSGTISKVYGAYEAIKFIKLLNQHGLNSKLKIVGKVVEKDLFENIYTLAKDSESNISLIGGKELVSHDMIISEMKKADFVLLTYQENISTNRCIPTKLYECLALKIPMIIQKNQLWEKICIQYDAALFIDFNDFDFNKLCNDIKNKEFFKVVANSKEALWETEEKVLFKVLEKF